MNEIRIWWNCIYSVAVTARACAYVSFSHLPCLARAVGDKFTEGSRSWAVTIYLAFPSFIRTQRWLFQGSIGDTYCQLNLNIYLCFLKPWRLQREEDRRRTNCSNPGSHKSYGPGPEGHVALLSSPGRCWFPSAKSSTQKLWWGAAKKMWLHHGRRILAWELCPGIHCPVYTCLKPQWPAQALHHSH